MSHVPNRSVAVKALDNFIQSAADVIGPAEMRQDADLFEFWPEGHTICTGWVLMTTWMDEEGELFRSAMTSPDMPDHVYAGILTMGLRDC